jgi:hypothetical protein
MKSSISNKDIKKGEAVQGIDIREGILAVIKEEKPDFGLDDFLSLDELNHYRRLYLSSLISEEHGQLANIDKDVIDALKNNSFLTESFTNDTDEELTLGQRLTDKIALFGGSWAFIITFFSFILIWMSVNIFVLASKPFDPYPFILLNLVYFNFLR